MSRSSIRKMTLAIIVLVVGGVVFGFGRGRAAQGVERSPEQQAVVTTLLEQVQSRGRVPIIVGFSLPSFQPEAFLADEASAQAQVEAIAQGRTALLDRMAGYTLTNVKEYQFIPFVAMTVDEAGLQALASDPQVTTFEEDSLYNLDLAESVPLVRAHYAHQFAYRGTGQTVAILDTGVSKGHDALAGKVVSEACYSTSDVNTNATSLCPNGAASSTAVDSGLNCTTSLDGCDHGTHVAGIAAAVAPSANLIAIQVMSRSYDSPGYQPCGDANRTSPCAQAYKSDTILGMERVYALRNTYKIAAVNMSLGGGSFTSNCDATEAATKAAVGNLRAAGIAAVATAGNRGSTNSTGAPGCISTVISVGATTKSNQLASFSNIASFVTTLAPGQDITAPVPGNITEAKNGTSMAAPHVTGAIAIFKQVKPNATVLELAGLIANSGPSVTDTRLNGTVTKRRFDVYTGLCNLITCDTDDFRTLFFNSTLSGNINPTSDRDHYYYYATAGARLVFRMNRTSTLVDPFIELYDPDGFLVAMNNDGGGEPNALINGYLARKTGVYILVARSVYGGGAYTIQSLETQLPLNPIPSIGLISPSSATATSNGADFWVSIYGTNFLPVSKVLWNGQQRTPQYMSSNHIRIRVRGTDISPGVPFTNFINVRNPTPGGGLSNFKIFSVYPAFLGESELLTPAPGSSLTTGIAHTFAISWTHPTEEWRVMQNMDFRLRDENNNTAAWVRLVERDGFDSIFRLMNAAGEVVGEGLPGDPVDISLPGSATLHLGQSSLDFGIQTVVMTASLTFEEGAAGLYYMEFRVDNEDGEVQDDDIFGELRIVTPSCQDPVESVTLTGPFQGQVDTPYVFTANVAPLGATQPVTYTWAPEPDSGQGTDSATYSWPAAGAQTVFLGVENCGGFAADLTDVYIHTTAEPDLGITKEGPAVALAGDLITYTLTVTNSGANTAVDLVVTDVLPAGATYVSGGSLAGGTVSWPAFDLEGSGLTTQTQYAVTAEATITNSDYSAEANGGFGATGSHAVVTKIVDALVQLSPVMTTTLVYESEGETLVEIQVPGGSVFEETLLAYEALDEPSQPGPGGKTFAGRAFVLSAYQNNRAVSGFQLAEKVSFGMALGDGQATGLTLMYWDGSQWTDAGAACTASAGQVMCTVQNPAMGEYALFGGAGNLYLPLISLNRSSGE